MIFIKSVFAGFGALILSVALLSVGHLIYLSIRARAYPWQFSFEFVRTGSEFRVDRQLVWVTLAALLIFLCGFALEFRRASKRA